MKQWIQNCYRLFFYIFTYPTNICVVISKLAFMMGLVMLVGYAHFLCLHTTLSLVYASSDPWNG